MSSNKPGLDLLGLGAFKRYKLIFGVLFLVLLGVGIWLGIPQVSYGHMGRHPYIWELLPFVSCFNPILGIGLWLGFAVGDITTTNIGPATGHLGKEYWIILYLAMLLFALLPAIVGRLLAELARRLFLRFRPSRPAPSPVSPSPRETMYDGGGVASSMIGNLTIALIRAIFGAIGSGLTASILMDGLGGILPSVMKEITRGLYVTLGSDPSCFAMEANDIIQHTGGSIIGAGAGGATGGFIGATIPSVALGAPPIESPDEILRRMQAEELQRQLQQQQQQQQQELERLNRELQARAQRRKEAAKQAEPIEALARNVRREERALNGLAAVVGVIAVIGGIAIVIGSGGSGAPAVWVVEAKIATALLGAGAGAAKVAEWQAKNEAAELDDRARRIRKSAEE